MFVVYYYVRNVITSYEGEKEIKLETKLDFRKRANNYSRDNDSKVVFNFIKSCLGTRQ